MCDGTLRQAGVCPALSAGERLISRCADCSVAVLFTSLDVAVGSIRSQAIPSTHSKYGGGFKLITSESKHHWEATPFRTGVDAK